MNKLSKQQALLVLKEAQRRNAQKLIPQKLIDSAFPEQRRFLLDNKRLKALICPRRSAKSYTAALHVIKDCIEQPNVTCGLIGLTRQSIKDIFWRHILVPIFNEFNISYEPNLSELAITFSNGSRLFLAGADASQDEMLKFLGQKYKTVAVDEASMYRIDLHELIYSVLKPATQDYLGTVLLMGTPSNFTHGLFYDLTFDSKNMEDRRGWNIHHWTPLENPYVRDNHLIEVAELIRDFPEIETTAKFLQHYKGLWAKDEDVLVYKYPQSSIVDLIPSSKYHYVLGIDLGFNDATAFIVACYNFQDKITYFSHAEKHEKLLIDDVATIAHKLNDQYSFDTMVIDGANKQAVETLKQRYNLPLINADKTSKIDHIRIMNSELLKKKIKIVAPGCNELLTEYDNLVWNERKLKDKVYAEHPLCDNHLADAALYAWRFTYSYLAEEPEKPIAPNSEEALDKFWEQEALKILHKEEKPFWEE